VAILFERCQALTNAVAGTAGPAAAAQGNRRIIRGMQLSPDQQRALTDLCQRYRIRALKAFGSAATGLEHADSDMDLLVEFTPGQAPSAFELVDLRDARSQLFGGRPVDLAFGSNLDNPYRRRAIVPQLRTLYPTAAAA
jgi:uncharacterized protein